MIILFLLFYCIFNFEKTIKFFCLNI